MENQQWQPPRHFPDLTTFESIRPGYMEKAKIDGYLQGLRHSNPWAADHIQKEVDSLFDKLQKAHGTKTKD